MMPRLRAALLAAGAALLATTALSAVALAAPMHERVRGTIAAINGDTLTVRTMSGAEMQVALTGSSRYAEVLKSSLNRVDPGSYIGTATKSIGNELVALEVVVFPPSMRGVGEGHYAWDRLPDTTLAGQATTASTMTNGTVSTAQPAGGSVNTTMTNGTVASAGAAGGAKEITVTYKGGKQMIIVPPTAPVVTYAPGSKAELKTGANVFVNGVNHDGKVTALFVAVGADGLRPPM